MKKTGSFLTVYALEQIGVKYTFGIPGVHNTEIYDELNNSSIIEPVLVTHEGGASFMADGISRTTDSIGTVVIVPAAGTTHAMSGIGEAFLDGIPMMVISGGTRRDTGKHYQLHQLDLGELVGAIVKQYYLVEKHEDIIPTIYKAYEMAISGEPGPVFIEIPVELQLFRGEVDGLPEYHPVQAEKTWSDEQIKEAARLLNEAKKPGIYVGWGGLGSLEELEKLAERLNAPVSTTFSGLSAFRAIHPMHTGVGFGASALPAARKAFVDCDCLLAIGVRFSELATGSYGMNVPEQLIHIDINPQVFHKNYPATLSIEGDAHAILTALEKEFEEESVQAHNDNDALKQMIASEKEAYRATWMKAPQDDMVSPGFFFQSLRQQMPDDVLMVVDDGKHTFLTAELFPVHTAGHLISPTDFNCMGYAIPASIGAKFGNPDKTVVTIVGDGAFQMTCMELITATTYGLGIIVFVFHDGELGQISQFQKIPLNRKTCTTLGDLKVEGVAIATGARYLAMNNDNEIDEVIKKAKQLATENVPVIVDVKIDYTQKTMLTKGVVKTNLRRFPLAEKIRFIGRAVKRNVLG
ncbi:MAG: thiamine pyrophosphate-binding protein [Saprospiraceae bacterium]|nr:thiamine pyrophosphate-binding protein [Saprospiraceae bacterium]MCB9325942.1 thiamine pyrophosphate-binding protein [Lewinellaceae bacterium]